ncbi:hypothetical protein SAMN05444274_102227 [Mariniphaga anaerophila]|uniref:Uncharacterized protein n=1 Tax=Mariniphaga anaerophila TaxID=1484053 RepID=A0A1M4VW12_9BACT|nr:hypothetical protein SAMN05444274_102227 [Mariniphaga anaerophila]
MGDPERPPKNLVLIHVASYWQYMQHIFNLNDSKV